MGGYYLRLNCTGRGKQATTIPQDALKTLTSENREDQYSVVAFVNLDLSKSTMYRLLHKGRTMNESTRNSKSKFLCQYCKGNGYVVKTCSRCNGSGQDPFFSCLSGPCIECKGMGHHYYVCSHLHQYDSMITSNANPEP